MKREFVAILIILQVLFYFSLCQGIVKENQSLLSLRPATQFELTFGYQLAKGTINTSGVQLTFGRVFQKKHIGLVFDFGTGTVYYKSIGIDLNTLNPTLLDIVRSNRTRLGSGVYWFYDLFVIGNFFRIQPGAAIGVWSVNDSFDDQTVLTTFEYFNPFVKIDIGSDRFAFLSSISLFHNFSKYTPAITVGLFKGF